MRRLTLWILGSSIISATGLFQLKHQVVRMEDELKRIMHDIQEEKKHIHVLEAEWGYLNNPTYLQKLVKKHLPGWHPLSPSQIVPLKLIPFKERSLAIPDSLFHSLPTTGVN